MGLILGYLCLDFISVTNTTDQLFGDTKIIVLMSVFSYPLGRHPARFRGKNFKEKKSFFCR